MSGRSKEIVAQQWDELRKAIIVKIIEIIGLKINHLLNLWIKASNIFSPGKTLPIHTIMHSFRKGLWNKPTYILSNNSWVYHYVDDDIKGYFLLLERYNNSIYINVSICHMAEENTQSIYDHIS